MQFQATDVVAATGGHLIGLNVDLVGVGFDSRTIVEGQLFVPIVSETGDGHDFIEAALTSGAAAYLAARSWSQGRRLDGTAIVVDDTLHGLMDLARHQRDTFSGTVIGVTGSVGKTSTKDLLASALRGAGVTTWANERSFNNDQGLPTTLLNAPVDSSVLVLEMGMRGTGEIGRLCRIAQPHIGVVTRVGEAHASRLGGLEGVANAKAELITALPVDGTAVLNGDDPYVRNMASRTSARSVMYGSTADCDVQWSGVMLDDVARARFRIETPWGSADVRLGVSGEHMVANAAAALACVGVCGASVGDAAAALSSSVISPMRMDMVRTQSGAVVINDCYNANPTSMRAALETLAAMPARRKVAVLGLMAEITEPVQQHLAIAEFATSRGISIVAVGTDGYGVTRSSDLVDEESFDEVVAAVGPLDETVALLVKASRSVRLERVADALVTAGGGRAD